jgi:hypothetical protein
MEWFTGIVGISRRQTAKAIMRRHPAILVEIHDVTIFY